MKNFRNALTLSCFIFLIAFFFINQFTHLVRDSEYDENKKMADKPSFDINHLDKYPNQYENYLSDNFSLRGSFLKEMGKINANIWHKSPKPDKLIIGQDNWLFNVENELDTYYGKRNFSEQELNQVLNEFLYRKKVLDSMGIDMFVVINPTKYSVYSEFLPKNLQANKNSVAANQIVDYFKKNSTIDIIYSKDFLMNHKKDYQLYFKGDNHWNEIGGYFAAQGILNSVKTKKEIPSISLDKFNIDTVLNTIGNLAKMGADAEAFAEPSYKFTLKVNDAQPIERFKYQSIEGFAYPWEYQRSFCSNNDMLPNAVIIRDSFGNALIPYMKNSFNYSTFIFDAWQYKFNLDIIEKEKPDIVIYMILESLLPNLCSSALTKSK